LGELSGAYHGSGNRHFYGSAIADYSARAKGNGRADARRARLNLNPFLKPAVSLGSSRIAGAQSDP
jgi:hypothetical protein